MVWLVCSVAMHGLFVQHSADLVLVALSHNLAHLLVLESQRILRRDTPRTFDVATAKRLASVLTRPLLQCRFCGFGPVERPIDGCSNVRSTCPCCASWCLTLHDGWARWDPQFDFSDCLKMAGWTRTAEITQELLWINRSLMASIVMYLMFSLALGFESLCVAFCAIVLGFGLCPTECGHPTAIPVDARPARRPFRLGLKRHARKKNETCVVCLERFRCNPDERSKRKTAELDRFPCGHTFHWTCTRHLDACPLCRC